MNINAQQMKRDLEAVRTHQQCTAPKVPLKIERGKPAASGK